MKKLFCFIGITTSDLFGQAQHRPLINGNSLSSSHISSDGKTLYYTSDRIQGFYKRDLTKPALNYAGLVKENSGLFNSKGNILMIPVHLPNPSN